MKVKQLVLCHSSISYLEAFTTSTYGKFAVLAGLSNIHPSPPLVHERYTAVFLMPDARTSSVEIVKSIPPQWPQYVHVYQMQ